MISKFASSNEFGNEIFQEMNRNLSESGFVAEPEVKKSHNVISSITESLVKCAEKLEELGHPSAEKADKILMFIQKEIVI